MDNSLDTTNTWLAILAIAAALQTLMLVVGAVIVMRVVRSVRTTVDELEHRYLAPFSARMVVVADEVREVVGRVKQTEHDLRAQLVRLEDMGRAAKHAVMHRAWPVVGAARAVSAAIRTLSQPRASSSPPMTARQSRATTS